MTRRWIDRPAHLFWLERESQQLLDFYRAARRDAGGFGALDGDRRLDPTAGADTMLTARMVHCYALAHLRGVPGAAPLAEHGVRALLGLLRDDEYGGWYAAEPHPDANQTKQCYIHDFVGLAAASATHAAIVGARELLDDALAIIENRFWSEHEQAFVESYARDWTDLSDYRGGNSNMHGVEMCLALADVLDAPHWRERGLAIVERVIHRHAAAHDYCVVEHFHGDWSEWLDFNADRPDDGFYPPGATPGHALEWSRLLLHLEAGLAGAGQSVPQWLFDDAASLFESALRYGWQADGRPGIVYTVDWQGKPDSGLRRHWVHAEAAAAAAAFAKATGEACYEQWYRRLWDFIGDVFIDTERGSWRQELDAHLAIDATAGDVKPDLYHAWQATLIARLPLAPNMALTVQTM